MPANSRTYGVWERRNMSIGRRTLKIYIDRFEFRLKELNIKTDPDVEYLKLIYKGEVIWDQIKSIEEIEDPKEYVYDFTVPNNETFMINEGIIVHNTLNSVSWDQKITYINNNNLNCNVVQIGEMIDKLLDENKSKISLVDNSTQTEYLDISHLNYKVQSVDENGKMQFAHSLNGSSLALPRILACLLENHQTESGIAIPAALQPYFGAATI
jgi:hypothetical protein